MRHASGTHLVTSQPSLPGPAILPHARCPRILYLFLVALLSAVCAAPLPADTLTGTVKDPSGAVVAAARIEISGGDLPKPLQLVSDESGKFVAPNLPAGKYSVRVVKEGFDDLVAQIDLHGAADLTLALVISTQQTSVTV